jgi:hypothetical protein
MDNRFHCLGVYFGKDLVRKPLKVDPGAVGKCV